MDVVTAFLNSNLKERVYIEPPEGFPEHPNECLLLQKSLYSLKQSPRLWYNKLSDWLMSHNWICSNFDLCVFMHRKKKLWMTVYVDDINIFGLDEDEIVAFKHEIGEALKMTNEGEPAHYLRMQISEDNGATHIWLASSIQQALDEYSLSHIKTVKTTMEPSTKLQQNEDTADPKFKVEYQSEVGKLNYFLTKGRLDISFAVSMVSRYNSNPSQHHMDAVHRIFAYLKGTLDIGTQYTGKNSLIGYVDSDFSGCQDTSKSTTGWIFLFREAPISWCS